MKSIKSIRIPDGIVRQLKLNGVVLWKQDVIEQLAAPTITIDGDTLTMTTTDDRTEQFVIFADGVEKATVVKLISFSDANRGYQAVAGMTWGEWVESEYNTGGWYKRYSGDLILKDTDNIGYTLIYNNGTIVHPNDIIAAQAYSYYKEPL